MIFSNKIAFGRPLIPLLQFLTFRLRPMFLLSSLRPTHFLFCRLHRRGRIRPGPKRKKQSPIFWNRGRFSHLQGWIQLHRLLLLLLLLRFLILRKVPSMVPLKDLHRNKLRLMLQVQMFLVQMDLILLQLQVLQLTIHQLNKQQPLFRLQSRHQSRSHYRRLQHLVVPPELVDRPVALDLMVAKDFATLLPPLSSLWLIVVFPRRLLFRLPLSTPTSSCRSATTRLPLSRPEPPRIPTPCLGMRP